jgi:hypothetical protein
MLAMPRGKESEKDVVVVLNSCRGSYYLYFRYFTSTVVFLEAGFPMVIMQMQRLLLQNQILAHNVSKYRTVQCCKSVANIRGKVSLRLFAV